jgi:hypothetical protein
MCRSNLVVDRHDRHSLIPVSWNCCIVFVSRRKGAATSAGIRLLGTVWAYSRLFVRWFWQREDLAAVGHALREFQLAVEPPIFDRANS